MGNVRPGDVAYNASENVKICTSNFISEEGTSFMCLSGNKETLLLLSDVFKAVAESGVSDFHLDPHGAGSALFAAGAKVGLYIELIR